MKPHRAYLFFLSGIVAGFIIIGTVVLVMQYQNNVETRPLTDSSIPGDSFTLDLYSGLFSQTLTEMTYDETPVTSSFLQISPSGHYILFGANSEFNEGAEIVQRYYLGNLETGERKEIKGQPLYDWLDDDVLLTQESGTLHLFDTTSPDSPLESYPITPEATIFAAKPSPDRSWLIINSTAGIYLADRETGVVRQVSSNSQDGAYAWFNDDARLLGFIPVTEEYGIPKHELVVWDVRNNEYDRIETLDFPTSTIKTIDWLESETSALVTTGWDDGSFIYSINLETGAVYYLGETSGEGGVDHNQVDERLGLSILEAHTDGTFGRIMRSSSYFGSVYGQRSFNDRYMRFSPNLVNARTMLYLRQDIASSQTQTDIVQLDLVTGKETVLHTLQNWAAQLVITRDNISHYWITTGEDKLVIRPFTPFDF